MFGKKERSGGMVGSFVGICVEYLRWIWGYNCCCFLAWCREVLIVIVIFEMTTILKAGLSRKWILCARGTSGVVRLSIS